MARKRIQHVTISHGSVRSKHALIKCQRKHGLSVVNNAQLRSHSEVVTIIPTIPESYSVYEVPDWLRTWS